MNRKLDVAAGFALTLGFVLQGSAATVSFDLDGGGGPTQAGFVSIPAGTLQAVDGISGIGVDVSIGAGASASGTRDRGVAATTQGANNGDIQVPDGTFAAMYRDLVFANNTDIAVDITGLMAGASYDVTVWSYDSGATAGGSLFTQSYLVGGSVVGSLDWSGDQGVPLPGADPNTNFDTDYATTFSITADPAGNAAFTTQTNLASQGPRINGIRISLIPEPASACMGLLALGCASLLRRRV